MTVNTTFPVDVSRIPPEQSQEYAGRMVQEMLEAMREHLYPPTIH